MIPMIILLALLVALVVSQYASAVAVNAQRVETSKIKSKLETTKEEKETLESKVKKLESENATLKAKRQAKLDALKQYTYNTQIKVVAVNGSCSEWLASAGVTDTNNAMWLINKESGCNPNAVNQSSGACGVAQELPCGKSGCSLGDGACQIAWMQRYVFARYGSWAGAVQFHLSHGWY